MGLMTDIPAVAAEGRCAFCGDDTTFAAAATRSSVYGEPNPGGMIPIIPRPRVWLCGECIGRYNRREVLLGWCGSCFAWGAAFDDSPCGRSYEPKM